MADISFTLFPTQSYILITFREGNIGVGQV